MAQLVLPSQLRGRPPAPGSRRGLVRFQPVMDNVQAFTDASTRAPMGGYVEDLGGYVEDLGATPTNVDVVLTYLRAQKPTTAVLVSASNGQYGLQGGSGYLVIGPAYYNALPASVRALYPLGPTAKPISALMPSDARHIGSTGVTAGALLTALEAAQKPLVITSPTMATRGGMSTGAKVAIGVGVVGALYFLSKARRR
jgi:hypothetical protein